MRTDQAVGVYIADENGQYLPYSEGIITIDIQRGVREYVGPWTQAETGQLIITSRNPNLDPYVNDKVRYNRDIKIVANDANIFIGKISNINVDYRSQGKPPIITLTAFDMISDLSKFTFPTTLPIYSSSNARAMLLNLENDGLIPDLIVNDVSTHTGSWYAEEAHTQDKTFWQAVAKKAETDLAFVFADADNEVWIYGRDDMPWETNPIKGDFKSDGTGLSYTNINLTDGLDYIGNRVIFNNATGTTLGPYSNATAVSQWGTTTLTLDTSISSGGESTWGPGLSTRILNELAVPKREITEIEFDGLLNFEQSTHVDILDNIHITHTDSYVNIDRDYSVVGIRHSLTADSWYTTFVLRNFDYINTAMAKPTFSTNQTSGDTNFYFGFTIEAVDWTSITWDFGNGTTSSGTSPVVYTQYTTPGTYDVTATVTNSLGWVRTSDATTVTVVGALPTNTFTYSVDASNKYTFTFTGFGANTFSWNFGDGTTSSLQNPEHIYSTSGNKTVVLTCTNTYGSNTSSVTFNATASTYRPIRYVRIDANADRLWQIRDFRVNRVSTNNISYNKPASIVVPYKRGSNPASSDGTFKYGSSYNYEWNPTLNPAKITDGSYLSADEAVTYIPNPLVSNALENANAYIVIDLGNLYTDITSFNLYTDIVNPATYPGSLKIQLSTDGTTWYPVAEFNHLPWTGGYPGSVPGYAYYEYLTATNTATLPLTI